MKLVSAAILAVAGSSAQAAIYTSSSATTGTYAWTAGTGWDVTPVSGTTTTVNYTAPASTPLAGVTVTSNNDNAGNFLLNSLDTSTWNTANTNSTLKVTGNTLEFKSNGATTPTLKWKAGNTTWFFQTNIVLTNDTAFSNTSGTGNFPTFDTGVISGPGKITTSGGGMTFNGQNTYAGGTTISDQYGRVVINSSGGPILGGGPGYGPLGTGTITLNSIVGVIAQGGTRTLSNPIVINYAAPGFGTGGGSDLILNGATTLNTNIDLQYGGINLTFGGAIGQDASSRKMTISNLATTTLGGSNTFTGGLGISGGTVVLANNGALNSAAPNLVSFTSNAAAKTINLNGSSVTAAGLSTGATVGTTTVQNNHASTASVLTLDLAGTQSFGGVLKNGAAATLSLTKQGVGTQTLSGLNTYTGKTKITQGKLAIGINNALSSSSAMELNGGTLATGTFSEAAGTLNLLDNSVIDLGSGTSSSVLSFLNSSGLSWTAGKTLTVQYWDGLLTGGGTETLLVGDGPSGLTGAQINEIQFLNPLGAPAGTYGAQILSSGEIVPTIPEPATIALAGIGVLGLLSRRRRTA